MHHHEIYNNIPTLHEARVRLFSLEGGASSVLGSLVPLFKDYPNFGVCLVHAHCKLKKGEKMVSSETVSEPVYVNDRDAKCYPERWLANGDPYEFSRVPKGEVPKKLVESFYNQLKSYGGQDLTDLLGLCCFRESDYKEDTVWLERTEGRRNIVEPIPRNKLGDYGVSPASWRMSFKGNGSGEFQEFQVYDNCLEVCVDVWGGGHYWKHISNLDKTQA